MAIKKVQIIGISVVLVTLFLVACTPATAPAPAKPAVAPVTPAKPGWQAEWDKTEQGAKAEGTVLVVTTNAPEIGQALTRAFNSRFGISLEFLAGTASELGVKVVNERRAGIHSIDAGIIGFSTPFVALKPAGALESLDKVLFLPELTDPQEIQKVWRFGKLEWVDKDHTILGFAPLVDPGVAINTNLVKPGEIKGYRDLLEPKWKGKISMFDPTILGPGSTWFQAVGTYIMDWDYMRKLVAQEPVLTRDSRQQMEWLAHGKHAITIEMRPELLKEFVDLGAPVRGLLPEEGSFTHSAANVIILIKDTPHPNAAKLFINWLLSQEGQAVYSKAYGAPSGRLEVSTKGMNPLYIPDPKIRYARVDTEEALLARPEVLKKAQEIFGVLKK